MALGSACAGAALAWHHPLWPLPASVMFAAWCLVAAWRPGLWLLLVPALLPLMNFSPWTGWVVFEEFDLLLLGALAGGYVRLAWPLPSTAPTPGPPPTRSIAMAGLLALLAVNGIMALARGFADAGGFVFNWFAGYTEALNSLRVFKSLGFALLLAPLLRQAIVHDAALAQRRLASGMVGGLAVVTLAALWERLAFPGLFDFSLPYRTVALFWEMHVGGAALDAYLALAAPFAAWALISARRPAVWAAAGGLALLTGYVCLTTFSRGVYLAVGAPLLLLGARHWVLSQGRSYQLERWRAMASAVLLMALAVEVAAILSGGSFMRARLGSADQDLRNRAVHWQHGLELLEGPADWLLGIGLGRLPARYARNFPEGEFPGSATWREDTTGAAPGNGFAALSGPATRTRLGGQYALTQRVAPVSDAAYRVSLEVRVQARADIHLELCERHLLYDGPCQMAFLRVRPGEREWQHRVVPLTGAALAGSRWYAPRLRMFSVSVVNAGGQADIDNLRLIHPDSAQLLENANFQERFAQWLPAAQSYFLPWHIDNLFVEVLIERGALGLLLLAALLALALWPPARLGATHFELSAYLAASLAGAMLVGLVSSIMDMPRVAFLFYLLALFSIESITQGHHHFTSTRTSLDG